MRTSFVIDVELRDKLKALAKAQGRTLTVLLTKALTQFIKKETAK